MLRLHINSFTYPSVPKKLILKDITLSINQGEHLAILGASGSGKTTLLHLIYGLLELEDGELIYNETKLWGPSRNLIPGHSFMKLVAQEYDIMPFISVAQNIASYLDRSNKEKDEQRVDRLLEVVGLEKLKNTPVKFLSGGQKQRVALAKALAKKPKVLLLDEPFSSIDTYQKNHLRRLLFSYIKEENITCITATHQSDEALAFADTLLILKDGQMDALGTPQQVYNTIKSEYQGSFFDDITVVSGEELGETTTETLYLLPHQLYLSEQQTTFEVSVVASYFKGAYYRIVAIRKGVSVYFNHNKEIEANKKVYLKYDKN